MKKISEIAQRLLAGEEPALARAISIVENQAEAADALMEAVFHQTGHAPRIGITGPPGAGKSTLVAGLTRHMRQSDASVGIIAVDPTSPFTGGALLGDRIRMVESFTDPGVFIRSMASRGGMGGLARATHDAVDVIDAAGKDFVLIETVGVGQEELDIVNIADTTVVVLYPEAGDGVQAMKAGLMEIADIFVVNKADRDGADKLADEIATKGSDEQSRRITQNALVSLLPLPERGGGQNLPYPGKDDKDKVAKEAKPDDLPCPAITIDLG